MHVEHTDENTVRFIDYAAMSFMAVAVDDLNRTLKEHGVESAQVRQDICSAFLFGLNYQFDAGWFIQGDKKLFPKVCFAERDAPGEDENFGSISVLHVPTDASLWHEYAHGVAMEYFEEDGEVLRSLRTGSYDNEN